MAEWKGDLGFDYDRMPIGNHQLSAVSVAESQRLSDNQASPDQDPFILDIDLMKNQDLASSDFHATRNDEVVPCADKETFIDIKSEYSADDGLSQTAIEVGKYSWNL